MHVLICELSRDGQSILGSRDTLTGGEGVQCAYALPIHVLSRDGQSISGSRDTLTGGMQCACAHLCTVLGWSEYLGISGVVCRVGEHQHRWHIDVQNFTHT